MNAQDVILGTRAVHVHELKAEIAKLKTELQTLRDERSELTAHFDLALAAAQDLGELKDDGRFILVDGWNLILGAQKSAHGRAELVAQAEAHLTERPQDFVWIVLDGPKAATQVMGRVRVTYTGGQGPHRADKFICDFVRMACWRGQADRIDVRTHDKDFRKTITRLLGRA